MKRAITDYFQKQPGAAKKIARGPVSLHTDAKVQSIPDEDVKPAIDHQKAGSDTAGNKLKLAKEASDGENKHENTLSQTSGDDVKSQWVDQLPAETKKLLELEIANIEPSWLQALRSEVSKSYFLNLKKYLSTQYAAGKCIFPPPKDIYSWSTLTPLDNVKVIILGQDPYHNYDQAHGLAFSVRDPKPPPPSLINIYKELGNCYPGFKPPKSGCLTSWAEQGVLLLNACLTVEAHKANSHANKGWEEFTEKVLKIVLKNNPHVVIMAWGSPAAKRVAKVQPGPQHLILKSVHPSPLSASRGWFGSAHFTKANKWLEEQNIKPIDWTALSATK